MKTVPPSWANSYKWAWDGYKAEHAAYLQDTGRLTDFNFAREYVLIDLDSGIMTPLVDAPQERAFGYLDKSKAIWSRDGDKILLTGTFYRCVVLRRTKEFNECILVLLQ